MPLRNGVPITFKAAGCSDALDATDSFPGAMAMLSNLVPAPHTDGIFVPRPASSQITDFTGFTTPAALSVLYVVGSRVYGMIASASHAGKDEPFCYDLAVPGFVTIGNVTSGNSPTSPSTSGSWTPPTMAMIGKSRIMVTHPGFSGSNFVGWIDLSGFSSASITGDTHTSTTIDALSTNVLLAGWEVGYKITGTNIPANTYITAIATGGLSITISNAATGSTAAQTYTVTGGTAAAPVWGAGQVSGQPLPTVPLAVSQFNGRAYYACTNSLALSDSLNPMLITNATQFLTLGDSQNITALAGLPLATFVSGGVLQSLIAFKSDTIMFQITGDPATSDLAVNALNVATGTQAPNTIVPTPLGLFFVSPEGLRLIDQQAHVSDPIGIYGQGVAIPFQNAVEPTRMCAAYHQNVLRISVQNGAVAGTPYQEWWFDLTRKLWTGPHSFPASLIQPCHQAGQQGFILAAQGINAKLWLSNTLPNSSSSYTENGVVMNWSMQSSLMPDNQRMSENAMIEAAIGMAVISGTRIAVSALNESQTQIDLVNITGTGGAAGSVWGGFNWGAGTFGAAGLIFKQYQIGWSKPIVFKQVFMQVTGQSAVGIAIGNLYLMYQPLGYLLQA